VLPAVDVAGGQAVRLARGEAGSAAAHGDPRELALAWQAEGAEWIHLVDLDAAFGRGSNADLLATLVGELDVNVQLSGGIADEASLGRALATGCARVNLGATALDHPAWCARMIDTHGERIAVSLDVRIEGSGNAMHYRLAPRGGPGDGGDLWEALGWLGSAGCARYVVTDVSRDGTLDGPNLGLYRAVARATPAALIGSGGVATIDDLVALAEARRTGVNLEGVIVGKALATGRLTLGEALAAALPEP